MVFDCIKKSIEKDIVESGASDNEINEFLKHVRPLDLLVFRGAEGVSNVIRSLEKKFTGSGIISHVEMAVTRRYCPPIKGVDADDGEVDEDVLLSWGSTMSGSLNDGVNSVETGKGYFGVQVRNSFDLVKEYLEEDGANVGVCRLLDNPILQKPNEDYLTYSARINDLIVKLCYAYNIYNDATYNAMPSALLGALFPKIRPVRNVSQFLFTKLSGGKQMLFCSEFIAMLYIAIDVINDSTDGIIDGKVLDARDVLPVDFLGYDTDVGLKTRICDDPIWVKPLDPEEAKEEELAKIERAARNRAWDLVQRDEGGRVTARAMEIIDKGEHPDLEGIATAKAMQMLRNDDHIERLATAIALEMVVNRENKLIESFVNNFTIDENATIEEKVAAYRQFLEAQTAIINGSNNLTELTAAPDSPSNDSDTNSSA